MNRSTPPSLATKNEIYCEFFNKIPGKNSVLSREIKYSELWFDDLNHSGVRYGDACDLCWVSLSPIALCSEPKVSISCAEELEVNIIAHNNCLLCKNYQAAKLVTTFICWFAPKYRRKKKRLY